MPSENLNHKQPFELGSVDDLARCSKQRALPWDTTAMGVLRKQLLENFGLAATRAILTQFGFARGWALAEATQTSFARESATDWRKAGLSFVEGAQSDPLSEAGSTLSTSYEAEQHLLQLGRSDSSVCWTLCGLTSGYLSRTTGKEIYVLEDRCLSQGDAVCRLLGRTRSEWIQAGRGEELRFFEADRLAESFDVSTQRSREKPKTSPERQRTRSRSSAQAAGDFACPPGMVAESVAMRLLLDLTRRVAEVDSTVVIVGETGAGKERIARLVHDESPRSSGPFIAVSCGAITESLLESELFGHARGAFTGAAKDRAGLFEEANGGTLFLDEIGEVPCNMQVKLLRALQEREIRRVGENKVRRVDVRLVAATNRDLAESVARGTFRQDLYYRLRVVELAVPPLRERKADVLPLARVLLAEAATRMKRTIAEITPGAAKQLLHYEWPGNVRELENAMERTVALARGIRVELEDLPEDIRETRPAVSSPSGPIQPLSTIEKDYILASLALNGGNQTRTAAQLEIGSATLYRKLKSYGLIRGAGVLRH